MVMEEGLSIEQKCVVPLLHVNTASMHGMTCDREASLQVCSGTLCED